MIKRDQYGTYGEIYQCPKCGIEHGGSVHHITEQAPILCQACLNDDTTDINLRLHTIVYYIDLIQQSISSLSHTTSGLRRLM